MFNVVLLKLRLAPNLFGVSSLVSRTTVFYASVFSLTLLYLLYLNRNLS
jgi:hypothetical protein